MELIIVQPRKFIYYFEKFIKYDMIMIIMNLVVGI